MGMEKFINALHKAKSMDGQIIGEDSAFIKTELAKDDKQAWVNHMVEQHLKHETIDVPPPEFEITKKDFIKEISRREIKKMFGEL
jgi:hypothetical protein